MRFTNTSAAGLLCSLAILLISNGPLAADEPLPGKVAAQLGFTMTENADGRIMMSAVAPDSPAGRRGLLKGDLILVVDREVVRSAETLHKAVASKAAGDAVRLTLSRGKYVGTVTLRLAPQSSAAATAPPGKDLLLLGMSLAADQDNRVYVSDVSAASPAAKADIRKGDIVLAINDVRSTGFKQFSDAARGVLANRELKSVGLKLVRNGESYRTQVALTPNAVPTQQSVAVARRWGLRERRQAAVAHLNRLNNIARDNTARTEPAAPLAETYVGSVEFVSQLEETRASARLQGLPAGYYVVVAHSHGDMGVIAGRPLAAAPGNAATSDPADVIATPAGAAEPRLRVIKPGDEPVGPARPRKTKAERMIEDVPPVTPASAARANAGVEPASETEAALNARRREEARLVRQRTAGSQVVSQPAIVLGTITVNANGTARTSGKLDGDVNELAGLAIALHPVERADLTRFPAGAAITTSSLRAPLAAGVVGYTMGAIRGVDTNVLDTNVIDKDVLDDGVIDRDGIDASGRIQPLPPRPRQPLERR